jgi:hypothetical protein
MSKANDWARQNDARPRFRLEEDVFGRTRSFTVEVDVNGDCQLSIDGYTHATATITAADAERLGLWLLDTFTEESE